MNRDDIIRMAQEAGAFFDGDFSVYDMPSIALRSLPPSLPQQSARLAAKSFTVNASLTMLLNELWTLSVQGEKHERSTRLVVA